MADRFEAYSKVPETLYGSFPADTAATPSDTSTHLDTSSTDGDATSMNNLFIRAGSFHPDCRREACDDYDCTLRTAVHRMTKNLCVDNRQEILDK
jgi:hypothetical protein